MLNDASALIVGAGPVGSALALWWARHHPDPSRITLIDKQTEAQMLGDQRVLALSAGSLALLAEFLLIEQLPGADIQQVHISQQGAWGHTRLNASEFALPRLGRVVRYADLMQALLPLLHASGVRLVRPAVCNAVHESEQQVTLETTHGHWQADVVIHAEGGLANAEQSQHSYDQVAWVGEVQAERFQAGVAFERFTDDGPLALLPINDESRYSFVWCMSPTQSARRAGLADAQWRTEFQYIFGDRVGRFSTLQRVGSYPLALVRQPAVTARTVRIGNAAHILHPVAGQGLNLGLRDAYELAQAWMRSQNISESLQYFQRRRQSDRDGLVTLTDSLARGFTWPVRPWAGWALAALDACRPARHALARTLIFGVRS